MTKDEALRMAIETMDTLMMEKGSIYHQAINACKQALEQPEGKEFFERGKEIAQWADKTAQEPVAICKTQPLGGGDSIRQYKILWLNGNPVEGKLYTHPHQWQGLTNDEIEEIMGCPVDAMYSGDYQTCREVEAKLKEKNT